MKRRLEFGLGNCQRPEHRPGPDGLNLWESRRPRETDSEIARRHLKAKLECYRCPLLEDCERMVCHFEERNESVDGVVAGRYSTALRNRTGEKLNVTCKGCGELLAPQHDFERPGRLNRKRHAGEQFCTDCYPRFSRQARRKS